MNDDTDNPTQHPEKLPTGDNDCVTQLEAIYASSQYFQLKLRRPISVIRKHAEGCSLCAKELDTALANLERDKKALDDCILRHNMTQSSFSRDSQSEHQPAKLSGTPHEICSAIVQPSRQRSSNSSAVVKGENRLAPYALMQLESGPLLDQKLLVAKYVADRTVLPDGSGIFVDAGSQCFLTFLEIERRIRQESPKRTLKLMTSNKTLLDYWERPDLSIRDTFPEIEVAGNEYDVNHRAFYGLVANEAFQHYRSNLILIGACGFEIESGRLWLGTHAGEHELRDKKLLFSGHAKRRLVLLTPSKLGYAGYCPVDLLSIENCKNRTIDLVMTAPTNCSEQEQFNAALATLRDGFTTECLNSRGLKIRWTILTVTDGQAGHAITKEFPMNREESKVEELYFDFSAE